MIENISKLPPDCFLCGKRPVSSRKSHFTPATATENVFGDRNKEEIYSITAEDGEVESYFGRGNTKNKNPQIKKALHTEPYVFCKECEENLSKIESKVTPLLNAATKDLVNGTAKTFRTTKYQKYLELSIHPNLFSVYLYSVIWRQAFQQIYNGQDEVFSRELYDKLRIAVAQLIEMKESEIAESSIISSLPNIVCLTTTHTGNLSDSVNPNITVSNPELFFMGAYDCLLFKESYYTAGFRKATGLKINPSDPDLYINKIKKTRILIIPEAHWQEKRKKFWDTQSNTYLYYTSCQIAKRKRIPLQVARNLLNEYAMKIEKETGRKYADCLSQAYKTLMK